MQMKEIINAESKKRYPEGPECAFFEELWYYCRKNLQKDISWLLNIVAAD